jgi:two-component system, NarL family, sensor histidine kinase UhpB
MKSNGHQPIRILLVEDSEDDAELLLIELRRGGYAPVARRVASAEEMKIALEQESYDLVISDYVMPGFGGLEALSLFRERAQPVPFIVVSGHIGEEIAVAAMKAGADDYLMKDRLARLVPAIKRALQEAEIRRAHQRANEALRDSEERFRQLAENIGAAFFMFEGPDGHHPGALSYVSPGFKKVWGFQNEALLERPELWINAIHADDHERIIDHLWQLMQGQFSEEFRIVRMDREVRWVHFRSFPVRDEAGLVYRVAAIAEDITERKRAEEQLAANAAQLQRTVDELRAIEEELRHSNEELSKARTELEERVLERTSELAAANRELQNQMSERKRLENELLEIAENERRRIGFDLHDDLGQKLMGVSLLLKALETNLTHKRLPEADETRKVQTLIHQVINHTHNLAHCFSSLESAGEDLSSLFSQLTTTVSKTFHISCRFRALGEIPLLPADTTLQLYKIAQESVSNSIKHGKATHVSVLLARRADELILRIKNDGVPFPVDRGPSNRLGLRIMNYRAHLIGGSLDIQPNGNSGTLVSCVLRCVNGQKNTRLNFSPVHTRQTASEISESTCLPA